MTIFIINGLFSKLWEGIVHKIKKLLWPQAALNLLSQSLYPASLPLYHCCIWTIQFFKRRLSVKQTLVIFFSKIWIFFPYVYLLIIESTGDYCKHYRHYNNFLLYCISEIFWYKYNFASRAVNNSLEKTRSMCILLKMYELIYTIMRKKNNNFMKQSKFWLWSLFWIF